MNNPLVEELCRTVERRQGDVTDELFTLEKITRDMISRYCRNHGHSPNTIFMGTRVYMLLLLDRRLLLRKETKQSGDPYDSYM
jgi:hypothetical protein